MLIVLIIPVAEPISAQQADTNPSITVTTDKSSYIFGDTIVIFGTVKTLVSGNILTVEILDPYSNLIQKGIPTLGQDGSYIYATEITGSLWKSGGVYTVLVQYGSGVQTQTTFAYTSTTAPVKDIFHLQIPGGQQIFDVPYTISGGSVTKMSINPPSFSLIVSIQANNYGSITLSLPRALIDAKTFDGSDEPFTILVDGEEIKPQKEDATLNYRTLTIQFLQGDKNIKIIGTSVASQNNSAISSGENLTANQESSGKITNASKLIPVIPEFPFVMDIFVISILLIILMSLKIKS